MPWISNSSACITRAISRARPRKPVKARRPARASSLWLLRPPQNFPRHRRDVLRHGAEIADLPDDLAGVALDLDKRPRDDGDDNQERYKADNNGHEKILRY